MKNPKGRIAISTFALLASFAGNAGAVLSPDPPDPISGVTICCDGGAQENDCPSRIVNSQTGATILEGDLAHNECLTLGPQADVLVFCRCIQD